MPEAGQVKIVYKPTRGIPDTKKVFLNGYVGTLPIDIPFDSEQEARQYAENHGWTITKSIKSQPSDDIPPEKARQIMKDGEANGKPLSDAQRRMFGAAAGKGYMDIKVGDRVTIVSEASPHRGKTAVVVQEANIPGLQPGSVLIRTDDGKELYVSRASLQTKSIQQVKDYLRPAAPDMRHPSQKSVQQSAKGLTPEEENQLKVAKQTLKMPNAMAGVMGGTSKEEAQKIVRELEAKKQGAKSMPDTPAEMLPPEEEETKSVEPYGAQVLRRLHEDGNALMKDYDEMHQLLDHPQVKDYLHEHLSGVEKHLSAVEKMFGKHYKDLPPLEGAEEPQEEMEEMEEGKGVEDEKPVEEATSGAGDVPEAGEVIEGMEKHPDEVKEGKGLKGKAKALPAKTKALPTADEIRASGNMVGHFEKDEHWEYHGQSYNINNDTDKVTPIGAFQGKKPDTWKSFSEAKSFLKALSEDESSFGDEERMKAYHYAKMLCKGREPGALDDADDEERAAAFAEMTYNDHKGVKAMVGDHFGYIIDRESDGKYYVREEGNGVVGGPFLTEGEAYRKAESLARSSGAAAGPGKSLATAAKFLKALAFEKTFGMRHREQCKALVKAMDEEMPGEMSAEEKAVNHPEVGDTVRLLSSRSRTGTVTKVEPGGIITVRFEDSGKEEKVGAGQLEFVKAFHKDELDAESESEETPYDPGEMGEKSLQTLTALDTQLARLERIFCN